MKTGIIAIAIVLPLLFLLLRHPNASQGERSFQSNKEEIQIVVEYLMNAELYNISIQILFLLAMKKSLMQFANCFKLVSKVYQE